MHTITLKGTQLRVSRWSFGTGSLHHLFSGAQRRRLLEHAVDTGFTHFDTSPYYGYGLAEVDLGRFMRHQRQHVTIATKVGLYPPRGSVTNAWTLWAHKGASKLLRPAPMPRVDWRVTKAERSLDASLVRLQTDHVDVLFLHEPDPELVAADEFLHWLEREVTRGRIGTWGLAGINPSHLDWVQAHGALARVLQVRDSLQGHEADTFIARGHVPQFTYGYLSRLPANARPGDVLAEILRRNRSGSVIVSTRRTERLAAFAAAAELEQCE